MITANEQSVLRKWTLDEFQEACNVYGNSWNKSFAEEWSTGGNWCNCWGEDHPIDAEDPKELDGLYQFLTEYFPHMTYLQMKALEKRIESTDTSESDWYGGVEYKERIELSYDVLMEELVGFGVLEIVNA